MADWDLVTAERRALVALLESLHGDQWSVPSLCPGWAVHDVLAHLASALDAPLLLSLKLTALSLGRPAVLIEKLTAAYADRSDVELLALLSRHADSRFAPPGAGWKAPLTDVMVHRMDVAVPLGVDPQRPPEAWRPVLEFLTSRIPMMGSIRGGRPPVTWGTTDVDWSAGTGPEVTGAAAAVGTTLAGRGACLSELSGPGVDAVRSWLA